MTKIDQQLFPSTHYNERVDKISGQKIPIDVLVLHCSAYPTHKMINVLMEQGLSAHYIIDIGGKITQLVDERYRAWHAGVGSWYGMDNINAHSIGIEIINPSLGHSTPYPQKQISATISLCQEIIKRYDILPHNVIAHSDLAPTRKFDPGRLFPWEHLANNGIGLWVPNRDVSISNKNISTLLHDIGYPIENEKAALRAFVRHFSPEILPDQETENLDQFKFLCEYEKYLPDVLKLQKAPNEYLINRLNQIAQLYSTSRMR